MRAYVNRDKVMGLTEAAMLVNDGDKVAVGGNLCAREPIAMIRELIRQGKRDLHTIGGAHGFDIDLMCGGGIVGAVQNSFVGFEADFGLAPNYRRLTESGKVKIMEDDCNSILQQLRATQFGIPFMPMPNIRGSDVLDFHPEFKNIESPFTGEDITLVPALKPDVAIIHAHKADKRGNVKLFPGHFADPLFVETADKVIVTVEELVTEEELKRIGVTFPYYEITAIVPVALGAHPTSCYPYYSYDRQHISEYMRIAKQGPGPFRTDYLEVYVLVPKTNEEYIALIGGEEKISKLKSWSKNKESWMGLFVDA